MDIGAAINDSWAAFKKWPAPIILGALIMNVIANIAGGLLTGHFLGGVAIMASKAFRGEEPEIGDVFKSFEKFVDYLLVGLAMMVGVVVCVVGVIVTAILFIFAPAIIAETGCDWKTALGRSKDLVTSNLGDVIMLVLAGIGINLLGVLMCLVGVLVTGPLYMMVVTRAYQQIAAGAAEAQAQA